MLDKIPGEREWLEIVGYDSDSVVDGAEPTTEMLNEFNSDINIPPMGDQPLGRKKGRYGDNPGVL